MEVDFLVVHSTETMDSLEVANVGESYTIGQGARGTFWIPWTALEEIVEVANLLVVLHAMVTFGAFCGIEK